MIYEYCPHCGGGVVSKESGANRCSFGHAFPDEETLRADLPTLDQLISQARGSDALGVME